MNLSYSCSALSGSVIVWEEAEVFADLSDSDGSFDERVSRAREIVEAINAPRDIDPQDLHSEADYWQEMKEQGEATDPDPLVPCDRCEVLPATSSCSICKREHATDELSEQGCCEWCVAVACGKEE